LYGKAKDKLGNTKGVIRAVVGWLGDGVGWQPCRPADSRTVRSGCGLFGGAV